jgi:alpha-D-ribose 1-methylphosphonate 5-phosphate C-P lyase
LSAGIWSGGSRGGEHSSPADCTTGSRPRARRPHTDVEPLAFEDVAFQVERTEGASCLLCGAVETYLVEVPARDAWICSDTDWCERRRPAESEDNDQGEVGDA